MIVGVIGLMTWQLWPFLQAVAFGTLSGTANERRTWAC